MKINKLLNTGLNIDIKGIKTNSKDVEANDVFVCALGNIDKTLYIEDAIKRGCCLVIANRMLDIKVPLIITHNPNLTLKNMLDKYYNYPLNKIKLIGVTGTDGKTSITTILKDMTSSACIGTNGLFYKNIINKLDNTTPSLDKVYASVNDVLKNNLDKVFMEVSSEAYLTNRIPYLKFDIGIFSNITKEHLDKHKTFSNYLMCKEMLLKASRIVVLNRDSKYFRKLAKVNSNYVTYGMRKSDMQIISYKEYFDHTIIKFKYQRKHYIVNSPLIGKFNVYNLMAAFLTLTLLKYSINEILELMPRVKPILGRNEILPVRDFYVILDHAHTINAIKNILKYAKKMCKGKIIVVLGCAGRRYYEKRAIIGKMICKEAGKVILTTDDPRDEDPYDIIRDMLKKVSRKDIDKILQIVNREDAIKKSLSLAKKNDFVLILGRGRDDKMYVGDEITYFSDYDIIKKYTNN